MTNPTPAPNAGHAAETMSDEALVREFDDTCRTLWSVDIRDRPDLWARYDVLHAELMKRLNHTAPARTAGTETVE